MEVGCTLFYENSNSRCFLLSLLKCAMERTDSTWLIGKDAIALCSCFWEQQSSDMHHDCFEDLGWREDLVTDRRVSPPLRDFMHANPSRQAKLFLLSEFSSMVAQHQDTNKTGITWDSCEKFSRNKYHTLVHICPTEITNNQAWCQAPRGKQSSRHDTIKSWYGYRRNNSTLMETTCRALGCVHYTPHLICLSHLLRFSDVHTQAPKLCPRPHRTASDRVRQVPAQSGSRDPPLDE